MLNTIFYILSVLFIWNEFYYLKNISNIVRLKETKVRNIYTELFHFTNFTYWIWIFIGLFTEYKYLFLSVLIISLIKLPLYHINKNIYQYYSKYSSILRSILLVSIIYIRFKY